MSCSTTARSRAQVPVAPGSPIASQTVSTAHAAGWIWDIGLPGRRGIGCVYASRFMDDDAAEATLRDYIARVLPDAPDVPARRLTFLTGHRVRFWEGNCVAVGLSAGFIEPLEASAIVMIELSLKALIDNFPAPRAAMPIHAARFNELFRYRWDRIVEFLKLHYALSRREEPYWLRTARPGAHAAAPRGDAGVVARPAAVGVGISRASTRFSRPKAINIFSVAWAIRRPPICRRASGRPLLLAGTGSARARARRGAALPIAIISMLPCARRPSASPRDRKGI